MWEDVIQCLVAMGETTKALALCRERLGVEQTPRLLCVLGDLTNDKAQYEEAWVLSGNRYSVGMGIWALAWRMWQPLLGEARPRGNEVQSHWAGTRGRWRRWRGCCCGKGMRGGA
jgi:hypothetical protein